MCKKLLFLLSVLVLSLVYTTSVSAGIVYVDASQGEGGNTALATGEVLVADDPGTVGSGSDNLWRGRVYANEGSILESAGDWSGANPEDCPRLVTTIDVPEGSYDVYAYFWGADAGTWRIAASLENSEGDLPVYICNDPNGAATLAVAEDFAEPVPLLSEDNRTLWQVYLGAIDTIEGITVYIDDDPTRGAAGDGGNARTWYDGVGYEPVTATEPAPKIIFVTSVKDNDQDGVQDDIGWYDWLTAEGYDVDFRPGNWVDPLDANEIAELEAADLIIASRGIATGEYDGTEAEKWNALTTPIICTNAWMVRNNSKWFWMNSGSANKDAGSPLLMALETTHPIFEGVALDADGLAEILDPTVGSGHTSFLTDILDVGNGTLIAQSLGIYSTTWIAEWPAGVEYYDGAGQVAGGPRMLFMAGTQDDPYLAPDGVNTAPVGLLNLNDAGKQLFLNAVEYMLPSEESPAAAMIVNDITLPNGFDAAQKDRLESLGYTVTLATGADVSDGVFTAADAEAFDVLVVSESIGSSQANNLIGANVPMMHQESYGWSRHFFTQGLAKAWLNDPNGMVEIVDGAHQIVTDAGLAAGDIQFFANPAASWTTDSVESLVAGAVNVAQALNADGVANTIIFTIEAGTELADASLAANRVCCFSIPGNESYVAADMTDDAWALFDAAIAWLDQ